MMAVPSLWGRSAKLRPRNLSPTFIIGGLFFYPRRSQPCFGQECFGLGSMRGCPRTTSRRCPCKCVAMREYAAKRGWAITFQIKEVGSGAVERELREQLLAAARRREIDVVLVWRLDRWGRSLVDLVVTLKELASLAS